jgi:hypothetical protein
MSYEEAAQAETATGSADSAQSAMSIPPYISFQTFLTFLSELKSNGLPPQIDNSVLKRFAGGVQSQLKIAVRSLGLLDGAKPTPALAALVDAYETPQFEPLLLQLLKATYPYVFALDLMSATPQMFADAFKVTGAKEDVARKCRTFFLHAAKRAGVPLGQRILTGSVPRGSSNGTTAKKVKAPKATPEAPAEERVTAPKPPKGDLGKEHPLVQGLLMTLPTPGKPWGIDGRASWLRMASSIFENIYQGKGTIEVKVATPGKETATGH